MANRKNKSTEKPAADFDSLQASVGLHLSRLFERALEPGLYLVATPIGHLGDITLRGLVTLAQASHLYCEDTRHSRKLLSAYGIRRQLRTYHDFSVQHDRDQIFTAIDAGASVAFISDAGTPLIADPGFKLVAQALDRGLRVFSIPGPSAMLSALVSSGMPSDAFLFCGFLPSKERARGERLRSIADLPFTIAAYETAPRLHASLAAIRNIMPERRLAVARELTKLNETMLRGSADELLESLGLEPLKGEIVLLIAPAIQPAVTENQISAALKLEMKTKSVSEAVEEVRKNLGAPKKLIYNLALKEKSK